MATKEVSERAGECMEALMVSIGNGHAFLTEAARAALIEGRVGSREALSHRIIGESGSGWARALQPGVHPGTPGATP